MINEPIMGFVMLNPSTADESVNDPTIKRCLAFARREGAGGILVGNLCAFRCSKPTEMFKMALEGIDVIYRNNNDVHLDTLALSCNWVVAAWGSMDGKPAWIRARAQEVKHHLKMHPARNLTCLGTTKHGDPRHPLMVPGDSPLVDFL